MIVYNMGPGSNGDTSVTSTQIDVLWVHGWDTRLFLVSNT